MNALVMKTAHERRRKDRQEYVDANWVQFNALRYLYQSNHRKVAINMASNMEGIEQIAEFWDMTTSEKKLLGEFVVQIGTHNLFSMACSETATLLKNADWSGV